jgi:hypothetical protein
MYYYIGLETLRNGRLTLMIIRVMMSIRFNERTEMSVMNAEFEAKRAEIVEQVEKDESFPRKRLKAKSGFGAEKKRLMQEYDELNMSLWCVLIYDPDNRLESVRAELMGVEKRLLEICTVKEVE